jgi:hypothetical protein
MTYPLVVLSLWIVLAATLVVTVNILRARARFESGSRQF